MCARTLTVKKTSPGNTEMPGSPVSYISLISLTRYLSNFLLLLSASPLRVYSSKPLHLGTLPWPWVTPPPCPGPDSQSATLLQCVEISVANTILVSNALVDSLLSAAHVTTGIIPPPAVQLPISHRLPPLPVSFSPLQLEVLSCPLSTPSYRR